jgi:hypothetical protein
MPQARYIEWSERASAPQHDMPSNQPSDNPFDDYDVRQRIGELIGRYASAAHSHHSQERKDRH